MIDLKHLLTVGVEDDVKTTYEEYIAELTKRLTIAPENSKAALKALMNILITLEEKGNSIKKYESLPSLFITHRVMYMKLFDVMSMQGFSAEEIDDFWFHGKSIALKSPPAFIDEFVNTMGLIFEIFKPYLEADDDWDRFMKVVKLYSEFLKTKNEIGAMVTLLHQFSTFADKVFVAGYKKSNDGWGGKLDLDSDIYPFFFKNIIRESVEPYQFSDYVIDFLYDRLKEVGDAETVLSDLYDFNRSLGSNAKLEGEIKKADEFLLREAEKTVQMVEKQKGETLSAGAKYTVIKELTAYEKLEGVIYYYFDERRLFKIMNDTKNSEFFEKVIDTMRDFAPKVRHYVMYSFGKLLQAPNSKIKITDDVIEMFCRELKNSIETINSEKVLSNLPVQYRGHVPDIETRFVFNRMMMNTTSLDGFEKVHDLFRSYLSDQTDFPLIHEMFIERASERRHASALMSFYVAALLVHELGDIMPDALIKILAGRLALTYSFTRRLNLFQEIAKLRYEFDGTHAGRETLYYNGFDKQNAVIPEKEKKTPLKDRSFDEQWVILYHVINNRELAQALRLLDERVLLDFVYSKKNYTEEDLAAARMDMRGKVYKILDDKFLDIVSDEEEKTKHELENDGKFPSAYYGKYEKIRSILVAQFIASGWDVEVHELRRKGKKPMIRMAQNEFLRSIKNIDAQRVLEQYEYKEARETIDINTLRKQVDTRGQLLSFVNQSIQEESANIQRMLGLSDEAVALLSYCSTKLRSSELRVEQGVRQLVDRLRADLGGAASREPLPLDGILKECFAGKYGKIDVKVIKKDKSGTPLIDPETGELAEKTYTITPEKFPDYLNAPRDEVFAMDKVNLYRLFYFITLSSILSETSGSMAFIKDALATNKYVIAADGLKGQSLENQEVLEYARIKLETAHQLAPFELQLISA